MVGDAFEFALGGDLFALRIIEFVNRVRYRLWKYYDGDVYCMNNVSLGSMSRADTNDRLPTDEGTGSHEVEQCHG